MPRDRDVAAFAERAEGYEDGWRGRLHHEISDRTAQLALAQVSPLYLPTLVGSRRGKARTRRRAMRLLTRAGFQSPQWHALYAVIIGAVTASK